MTVAWYSSNCSSTSSRVYLAVVMYGLAAAPMKAGCGRAIGIPPEKGSGMAGRGLATALMAPAIREEAMRRAHDKAMAPDSCQDWVGRLERRAKT
mmetsp:Transcript_88026/g.257328  ORF Transcript_88026/g.257328 Transcript_88026/m.257328 type:complete len:95 (-) Transcript_88026:2-286(-)